MLPPQLSSFDISLQRDSLPDSRGQPIERYGAAKKFPNCLGNSKNDNLKLSRGQGVELSVRKKLWMALKLG
jgi:hypothetical protein